jgi:hypothetical protein
MQGRDIYNLQEAYLEIYSDLHEASGGVISGRLFPKKQKKRTPYDSNTIPGQIRRELWNTWHAAINQYDKVGKYPKSPEEKAADIAFANRPNNPLLSGAKKIPKGKIEKVDGTWKKVKVEEAIEMILLHLLDEGYADCLGSAEIILENMSDEWINSIIEEFVDPETGEAPSGRSPIENVSNHPNPKVRRKAMIAFVRQMAKEYGGKWKSKYRDPVDS